MLIARFILLFAGLAIVPLPQLSPSSTVQVRPLSQLDRQQAVVASRLALRSPENAVRWLTGRAGVSRAALGLDGKSIEVQFTDGGRLAILPREIHAANSLVRFRPNIAVRSPIAGQAANGRAIVLEPFANQLGMGPDGGQVEIDDLKAAGFQVDVLRNASVTVAALEHLADYSAIYMETHSYAFPSGDALLVADETDTLPYSALYAGGSLQQATIAGDSSGTLYNAITAKFVTNQMGVFPNHSIMYLNGCDTLSAPLFWAALHDKNLGTLISWDHEVYSNVNQPSAELVLDQLDRGKTVADSLQAAEQQGLAWSIVDNIPAHLGFLGDGTNTLAQARGGPLPTPPATTVATPTSTVVSLSVQAAPATPTPTATPRPAKEKVKCKRGWKLMKGKCVKSKASAKKSSKTTAKKKPRKPAHKGSSHSTHKRCTKPHCK